VLVTPAIKPSKATGRSLDDEIQLGSTTIKPSALDDYFDPVPIDKRRKNKKPRE